MSAYSVPDDKNRTAIQTIRLRMDEMASYTDRICGDLKMSAAARTAAERIYRKVICGRQWLLFRRHTDEQRFFLRQMVKLALAVDPSLVPRAKEVANYLSANYAFEWVNSEVTAMVREEAKAMILAVGDSSYGDTSSAGAFAYARFHYQTLNHQDVGDYGATAALTTRLMNGGEFQNLHDDWRKALGVDKLRTRREMLMGTGSDADAAPAPSAG